MNLTEAIEQEVPNSPLSVSPVCMKSNVHKGPNLLENYTFQQTWLQPCNPELQIA